ncbi:MAG: hypothetical protein K8F91_25280 [Candidatus Obscuribacterales bacterium]|nr:hypothetical protein [Candidatus Obscuribacterales bacterium]
MFYLTNPFFLGLLLLIPLIYVVGQERRNSVMFSSLNLQPNIKGSSFVRIGSREELTDIFHWFTIAAIISLIMFIAFGALVRDDL